MNKYAVEVKWNLGFEQMIEFSSENERTQFLNERDEDILESKILD